VTRQPIVFEEAAEEVEAQIIYYREHAGENVALRLINAIEAASQGLLEGRFVGVNHRRMKYRWPLKRVLLARFPSAVVFDLEDVFDNIVAFEALRRRPGYWRRRLR
jgi:plasmid stabilization system protein ParE